MAEVWITNVSLGNGASVYFRINNAYVVYGMMTLAVRLPVRLHVDVLDRVQVLEIEEMAVHLPDSDRIRLTIGVVPTIAFY